MMYPQAGIVTSLRTDPDNPDGKEAKVFIPLMKLETDWIRVAANLVYEEKAELERPVITADPSSTIQHPPKESPPPSTLFTDINGHAGTVKKVTWGTLRTGDEVIVVFLAGDINQGVIVARM
ncbi:hypothetical protein [Desulfocucumis palustris]|nr:hypothetical protein [Desulfocucumis palustris]